MINLTAAGFESNHLVPKRKLNHLTELAKLLSLAK